MAAGVSQESPEEADRLKELGLVGQHSYGLLSCAEVESNSGEIVKILQLRNPWGNFEWKGDWGDASDCWTESEK